MFDAQFDYSPLAVLREGGSNYSGGRKPDCGKPDEPNPSGTVHCGLTLQMCLIIGDRDAGQCSPQSLAMTAT